MDYRCQDIMLRIKRNCRVALVAIFSSRPLIRREKTSFTPKRGFPLSEEAVWGRGAVALVELSFLRVASRKSMILHVPNAQNCR